MSVTFYPYGPEDSRVIEVADPGYGYLEVWVPPSAADAPSAEGRTYTVAGPELGAILRGLVAAAKSTDHVEVPGLWSMRADEALVLLPAMQEAVIHAAAGSDRAERILDDPDPESPQRPVCVNCDVNRELYASANPHPNPWCERHGHTPFGRPPAGRYTPASWEQAEREYADAVAEAERAVAWQAARKAHEARRLRAEGLTRAEVAGRLREGRWVIDEDWVVRAERGEFDLQQSDLPGMDPQG